jgi:hypothetical protein
MIPHGVMSYSTGIGVTGGFATSRYFRLDNFVTSGGTPEIMCMHFQTGAGVNIAPTSIATSLGDRTTQWNDCGNFTNVSGLTFANFTFSSDKTPARFQIRHREQDVDFINSFDFHVCDDSGFVTGRTKLGSIKMTEVMPAGMLTDQKYLWYDIGVPAGIAATPATYVITV